MSHDSWVLKKLTQEMAKIWFHEFFENIPPFSSEFEGGVGLLYTKRSPLLRAHPRQVCFPGGIINPSETPNEAASRESNEELGINSSQIDIWTCMPELLGSVRDEGKY